MTKIRLLLLSGGSQVGQNVLAMLAPRRASVTVIATSGVADEPALFDCDVVHLLTAAAGPEAGDDALADLVERERIDLVIPCSDEDLVRCARLRERRPALATRLLCGSLEATAAIVDRWESRVFCDARGLPFAASLLWASVEAQAAFVADHGLPAVAMPRRGGTRANALLVDTPGQLAAAIARGDVVQQFLGDRDEAKAYLRSLDEDGVPLFRRLEGLAHSMQAIIAPDGRVAALFCTRRVRQLRRSKWVAIDDEPVALDIGTRAAQAFAAAGWRGPLALECLPDAHGALRIRAVHGRFIGGSMDRWLLGCDELGTAIRAFVGAALPFDREPALAAVEAFEARAGRAADPDHVRALTRDGVWRRAA